MGESCSGTAERHRCRLVAAWTRLTPFVHCRLWNPPWDGMCHSGITTSTQIPCTWKSDWASQNTKLWTSHPLCCLSTACRVMSEMPFLISCQTKYLWAQSHRRKPGNRMWAHGVLNGIWGRGLEAEWEQLNWCWARKEKREVLVFLQ